MSTVVAASGRPVDVNRATLAELETVKGIGPDLAEAILAERAKAPFGDWHDLARRVRGIGSANAVGLSAAGLSVDGRPFAPPRTGQKASAPR